MIIDDPKSKPDGGREGIAELIRTLDLQARSGHPVTLGDAVDQAGARMHGAAILLLALPESIPLPVPSIGAILSFPLMLISGHLALFGEHGELPGRIRKIRLPPRMIAIMGRYLTGPLQRAERLSRQRLSALARRERAVGIVCTAMSLLLLLPIPLMNAPPALAMVCLSWGLVQRDGLFVGAGIAMAVGVGVAILVSVDLILTALIG